MKKEIFKNAFFIIATIAFNILFWQEQMGVNVLLFSILIIGGLFHLNEESRTSTIARLTALGTLITAIGVILFNSFLSKIIFIISLNVMIGFVQIRELRFFWFGFLMAGWSLLSLPKTFVERIIINPIQTQWLKHTWRYARLSILPVLVVLVFFGLYRTSNTLFNNASIEILNNINLFFLNSFTNWTPERLIFTLVSVLLIAAMIWKGSAQEFINWQKQSGDDIQRIRKKRENPFMISPMTALKNEYRSALILLVTLNILTFLVNWIDVQNIWFGFAATNPKTLYIDVHYGTYVLIFTILIAMGVLMFFFRRNINFYKKNKSLKIASYIWLAQNAILVISVALRNIKYIDYYGLTYKRIGVFIFLLLVLFGLYTMILKIKDQRTPYFLIQRNSWGIYIVMIFLSTINWDVWITNYNISKAETGQIDFHYLTEKISDNNLIQLYENQDQIPSMAYHRPSSVGSSLLSKTERFLNEQEQVSWLSWNYADYSTLLYLKEHHLAD